MCLFSINSNIISRPIALQSGLGAASAKQLSQKIRETTNINSLVLSGLDVVLAVGLNKITVVPSGDSLFETFYTTESLQVAIKEFENMSWNPNLSDISMYFTFIEKLREFIARDKFGLWLTYC